LKINRKQQIENSIRRDEVMEAKKSAEIRGKSY